MPETSRIKHRDWGIVAALAVAATLGNYLGVPIFYGLDFLFGSIATLIAVKVLDGQKALIVAIVGSLYTLVLWGHPYAVITFASEALVVTWLMHRFNLNLLASGTIFWTFFGMPLVVLFYRGIMNTPYDATILIALKQGVNGIFNALVASLIVTYVPAPRFFAKTSHTSIPIRENLFNLLTAAVLLPFLITSITNGQNVVNKIQSDIQNHLRATSAGIAYRLASWWEKNEQAVAVVAQKAALTKVLSAPSLQETLDVVTQSFPDIASLHVADSNGKTIAVTSNQTHQYSSQFSTGFMKETPAASQSKSKSTLKPIISDIHIDQSNTNASVITVSLPIMENGNFRGYAQGIVSLEGLSRLLTQHLQDSPLKAYLLDNKNLVIASTDALVPPFSPFDVARGASLQAIDETMFHRRPAAEGIPALTLWQQSFYGQISTIPGLPDWRLLVEEPFAPHQSYLQASYTDYFGTIFGISLLTLLLAAWLSDRLSISLLRLAEVTTDLPRKLSSSSTVQWPKSKVREIDSLVGNFHVMTQALQQQFLALHSTAQELAQAKQAAEDANQAKSAFLANMSHEIRTPLGAMLGYAELMNDPLQSPRDRQDGIAAIKRNGEQLTKIIEEILDLSKIEAGRIDVEHTKLPVADLIHNGIFLLRHMAQEKGIRLVVTNDGPVPKWIYSDITRVRQVLNNILGNAIKFTQRGAVTVEVALRHAPGTNDETSAPSLLAFVVHDMGPGITPTQQKRLFQPFMQADSSTSRKYGGTGLGLVLARRLAQALGGDVEITASTPGKGSTFTITIARGDTRQVPLVNSLDDLQESFTQPANYDMDAKLHGARILVIDDAPDNRLLISRFLHMAGAQVETACNGKEGMTKAMQGQQDLILMDIQMPEMDGYETTRMLRSMGYQGPILALTAHAMKEDAEKCLEAGFNDHLAKPINRHVLLRGIEKHMNWKSQATSSSSPSSS